MIGKRRINKRPYLAYELQQEVLLSSNLVAKSQICENNPPCPRHHSVGDDVLLFWLPGLSKLRLQVGNSKCNC